MLFFVAIVVAITAVVVLSNFNLFRWAKHGDGATRADACYFGRHARMTFVVGLYVVTWIGGTCVYAHDMHVRALDRHAHLVSLQRHYEEQNGDRLSRSLAFKDGPRTSLHWSVPLLPGVLLVSSDYSIGPLDGDGGPRLVIWYVFGTRETMGFGWVA